MPGRRTESTRSVQFYDEPSQKSSHSRISSLWRSAVAVPIMETVPAAKFQPNGRSDGKKGASNFRLRDPGVETVRLRKIFDAFDENGDGRISAGELDRALQRLGLPVGGPDADTAVNSLFEAARGDGGLGFEEFVELHRALGDQLLGDGFDPPAGNEEHENDLKDAFRVFDEDGDGFICAAELQWVLSRLGLTEGQDLESCERMICGVDQNRDGLVDFCEFKRMMRSVIVRSS